ncbi:MAG TPA: trypsin-like serine protease [Tepidisphaeraceae bacterium]|nr:trypsin-like serine protease [Tepidisphaeraceae bacterium]
MNTETKGVAADLPVSWSWAVGGGVLAVLAIASSPSTAGTIRHDVSDQLYRDLANQTQFASVGTYSSSLFGSLTLIHPQWALTAAHVVDTNWNGSISDESMGTVRIGGHTRRAAQLIVPTGTGPYPGWNGNINNGFDIALVRLDQPITSIAPAAIYTSFQELGKTITSVGFGQTGTGKTGAYLAAGTKRAGNNVVDRFARGPNGELGFANGASALAWDFDEPAPRLSTNRSGSTVPLALEYLIAPGDSGGGSFIFENNAWLLAGVHSGVYPSENYLGAINNTSTYGDEALITRVASYQDFILSNIPELAVAVPEPANLALLALAGVLARRRRR